MSQLFTVRMVSQKIIVTYDQHGKAASERTELIPQVYSDLPYKTALAYKTKFPDAQVDIALQTAEFSPARGSRDAKIGTGRTGTSRAARDYYEKPDASSAPATSEDFSAAMTGDMAAAINAEMDQ
jgi:hypothetical protein